jgi:hypothetical protein
MTVAAAAEAVVAAEAVAVVEVVVVATLVQLSGEFWGRYCVWVVGFSLRPDADRGRKTPWNWAPSGSSCCDHQCGLVGQTTVGADIQHMLGPTIIIIQVQLSDQVQVSDSRVHPYSVSHPTTPPITHAPGSLSFYLS